MSSAELLLQGLNLGIGGIEIALQILNKCRAKHLQHNNGLNPKVKLK
jgi:hypothetical protein